MYALEQLKVLVLSAEHGSFSACAKKLGKAQSAVSQSISNLEIDLGIQLFDRSSRSPTLTEDGKRIYTYAKSVLDMTRELDNVVTAINREEEQILRIGFDSALMSAKFMRILEDLSVAFPKTQVELLTIPSSRVYESLITNQIDIGVVFASMKLHTELRYSLIGNVSFLGICHPAHELAQGEKIELSNLLKHRQIYVSDSKHENLIYLPKLSNDVWECNNFDTALEMVKNNLGWGIFPLHMVTDELEKGTLLQGQVENDKVPWSMQVELVTAKQKSLGVVGQWFLDKASELVTE